VGGGVNCVTSWPVRSAATEQGALTSDRRGSSDYTVWEQCVILEWEMLHSLLVYGSHVETGITSALQTGSNKDASKQASKLTNKQTREYVAM
jgi:hypothetical protein